jgi:hypothetical protein
MGRYSSFSGVKVGGFQEAVMEALSEYGDLVYQATEEGLAAAEKVLVRNLKATSPKKSGEFAKSWKGTGKKYKLVRFVGNSTAVTNNSGEEIALANIFEYSIIRGKPFIKKTFESSIDEMAAAVVAEIKKEA